MKEQYVIRQLKTIRNKNLRYTSGLKVNKFKGINFIQYTLNVVVFEFISILVNTQLKLTIIFLEHK